MSLSDQVWGVGDIQELIEYERETNTKITRETDMIYKALNGFMILELISEANTTSAGLILPDRNTPYGRYKVLGLPMPTSEEVFDVEEGDVVYLDKAFVYKLDTPSGEILLAQVANSCLREKNG